MASAIYSPRYYSKRSLIHSTPCPQTFFLVGIYHLSGEDSTLPFFDSSSTSRNKGIHALPLVKLFAPNAEQMYIVNHLKESPAEEKRTVLEESARRAHGDTQDLADLNSSKLEAVIIPVILGWPRTAPSTVL